MSAESAVRRAFTAKPKLFVALFFIVLTLVGLFTSADYGLPCDEPAEQVILCENLYEYALRFFGEDSEAARYYQGLGINRISESIERDHGQCAYYPIAPLLAALEDKPDTLMTLWHSYTWLIFVLGAVSLYGLAANMGLSRPLSCLASLLYALCPRFFAEGHYNNKDMALLALTLFTLWMGIRLMKNPTWRRGLLFALAGAMAANTKIAGLFAWGLMGLGAVIYITARREWSKCTVLAAFAALAGFTLVYCALTPALLAIGPAEYIRYILKNATGFTRWTGVVIFRGARYEPAVSLMPRSYLPYTMLTTLPFYVPVLCLIGQISALKRIAHRKPLRDAKTITAAAASLLWLVPVAFAVLKPPVVYNGWRHFYFTFAGLALMMALGISSLRRFAAMHKKAVRIVISVLMFAVIGYQIVTISINHPYQYGYYNHLARQTAETDMELDYWDVSTVNAMRRLASCERDESLPLTLGSRDEMSWFGVNHGYEVLSANEKARLTVAYDENAPYLFENTTYALIYGTPEPEGYHTLFTIESYENTLCTVYERTVQ